MAPDLPCKKKENQKEMSKKEKQKKAQDET